MDYLKLDTLSNTQKEEIMSLWNNEYPENLKYNNIEEFEVYLSKLKDKHHVLIISDQEEIKGWYTEFFREGRKWFAMIIDKDYQGKGIGSELLTIGKNNNTELNGWITSHDNYKKIDGSTYYSPKQFYIKNGFEIMYDEKKETDKLSAIKIRWRK